LNALDKPLLVLDIGTRKVAGLVALPSGRGLRVLAAALVEHPDRAMLDGQVHKIEAVAEVVRRVKTDLEKASGLTFASAAVAAAGRALLTQSAEARRKFGFATEVTREHMRELELAAARAAYLRVENAPGRAALHCVGYSPVRWSLDNEPLDDLVGHQGLEASVEVLATFLPRQVVDSLLAVLRRAGLQAASLTLEPIAALEATIPPDLRRMNLALVDIGAGTSDIAVTRAGSVCAYAMVTEAGDEITEHLGDQYLLEFSEAERVKRELETSGSSPVAFTTLLGRAEKRPAAELREALAPAVEKLAGAIAERIRALNGGSPRAVVMVGGGSATPGLGASLARALGLDPDRVGVRGPETIPDLEDATGVLTGIEAVTPLGIALSALRGRGLSFFNVQVNGHAVQLLALHAHSTVFDALLSAGHEVKRLIARPGQAVTYTLQGKLQVLRGTLGSPAQLRLNGRPASLDAPLAEGDALEVTEARDGEDARLTPELVPRPAGPVWFSLNERHADLTLVLACNGEPVAPGQDLPDRAELAWVADKTLGELCPELLETAQEPVFQVRLNGETRRLGAQRLSLTANREPVGTDYRPRPDDRIAWSRSGGALRVQDLVGSVPLANRMTVTVNGETKTLDYGGCRILVNGRPAQLDDELLPEAEVMVEKHDSEAPILSQALAGLPLAGPKDGGALKLTLDGEPAGFTTPLRDGARVHVSFT
jgi:cell division protein FtsA